jgi:hypothetical protein
MDKVRIIEGSLRCFVAGCLAMIPLLGFFPAVVAIYSFHSVRSLAGPAWNPAHGYLVAGCVLAWLGIALTVVGLALRFAVRLF